MNKKFQNKYRTESIRLSNWDYRNNADYFVTICTKDKKCFFGEINRNAKTIQKTMKLSRISKFAHDFWMEIPDHFPFVKLDAFVVMPNHVHGIITTNHNRNVACNISTNDISSEIKEQMSKISPKKGSLSSVIRSYKSAVTKHARQIDTNFSGQSLYHDHIIPNPFALQRIRKYINNNPNNWDVDSQYQV
ncbi:MAG: transposase [Flavobacteriaceae bacterium CG_4_10_14_0_8_um_filter_34_31]|nr:transposase [Flavobacteriia bacterium]PIZ07089.1 MAG: transposase [Flavobacteriaceae bacterium CG_4_10_14_0_8_um_filter_34_31]